MPACDYCGASILWGGTRDGDFIFCNERCHGNGILVTLIDRIPPKISYQRLRQVHQGACPECGGPGPVDVHTSHNVTSALVMTWWNSKPKVCCRTCGVKSQLIGIVWSGVLGWWGFPWGLIMTPIQLIRNFVGLVKPPDASTPTPQLRKMVNLELAARLQEKLSRTPDEEVIEVVEDDESE